MSDERKAYRFKWSNVDLESYIRDRRLVASSLRIEANILARRADQIDEEARELQIALEPVEPAPGHE